MIKLGDFNSPFGVITILRDNTTGSVIYEHEGNFQSESDSNGTSLVAYVHALFGLLREVRARSVLMIGGAGGTLGTMLAGAGCAVTIVDINPISFPLARMYFSLPEAVDCVVADGRDFLAEHAGRFDAIVVDAYQGAYIPARLRSSAFFRLASSRLSPQGVILANVHLAHGSDISAERVAHGMASVWKEVRVLDIEGARGRNAIVLAGTVASLTRPTLLMQPLNDAEVIATELAKMEFRQAGNVATS